MRGSERYLMMQKKKKKRSKMATLAREFKASIALSLHIAIFYDRYQRSIKKGRANKASGNE